MTGLAYYPSTWTIIGSSLVLVTVWLPFVLVPLAGVRRLIRGSW